MTSHNEGPVIATTAGHAAAVAQDFNALASNLGSEAGIPPLPQGMPSHLDHALAWSGADFNNHEAEYIYQLTEADLAEIGTALTYFKGLELDGDLVSQNNFPLPSLGSTLDSLSREVHDGRGFCVVRGIDPHMYTVEDLSLIYLGVQAYIADQRGRQDSRGNMLVHIIADNSSSARQQHHRHSTNPIAFHTEESGDVVGWLTRSTAAAGGKCIIASAYTIYNVLAAGRPDIIRTLARSDWPFALPRFQCRPVIWHQDSHLVMNFGRAALLGSANHPRKANLPVLTEKQREALDAVEAAARATELHIATRAGDMHFINNLAVLHRREGFVDGEGTAEKRHLVRLRCRSTERGWQIPVPLQREWFDAFDREWDRIWHLEPMPDAFFPLRKYPN